MYQCLGLNDQAKLRALGLLSAYVGGVRSVLPPAVNAGWDTAELESMRIADPGWVARVQTEIARLEAEVGDLGPEPPFVLTSVS